MTFGICMLDLFLLLCYWGICWLHKNCISFPEMHFLKTNGERFHFCNTVGSVGVIYSTGTNFLMGDGG